MYWNSISVFLTTTPTSGLCHEGSHAGPAGDRLCMVTCDALQSVAGNLWGTTKLPGGRNAEGCSLVQPCCGGICHAGELSRWENSKRPPLEAHPQGVAAHGKPRVSRHSTSGRMNCSTGLYHSLFTCTPQLGGLKRAVKRASYRTGGKRQGDRLHIRCSKFPHS